MKLSMVIHLAAQPMMVRRKAALHGISFKSLLKNAMLRVDLA